MPSELFSNLLLVIIVLIFNFLAATMWFARVSVKHIDRKLELSGVGKPEWDGIGIRISIYALAILSEWFAKTPLIAGAEVRAIARRKDYYLALWFELSFLLFLVAIFVIYPFIRD